MDLDPNALERLVGAVGLDVDTEETLLRCGVLDENGRVTSGPENRLPRLWSENRLPCLWLPDPKIGCHAFGRGP